MRQIAANVESKRLTKPSEDGAEMSQFDPKVWLALFVGILLAYGVGR